MCYVGPGYMHRYETRSWEPEKRATLRSESTRITKSESSPNDLHFAGVEGRGTKVGEFEEVVQPEHDGKCKAPS